MSASYQRRRELLELQVNINKKQLDSQVDAKEESTGSTSGHQDVCLCLPSEICLLGVGSQRSRCDKASANAAVQMQPSFDPIVVELRCEMSRKAQSKHRLIHQHTVMTTIDVQFSIIRYCPSEWAKTERQCWQ